MLIAEFKNGKKVIYSHTWEMYYLLMRDTEVLHLMDGETGELYK